MAPQRLRVNGFDGSAPRAIPGVPAPLRGAGRAHDLASVLDIIVAQAGLRLGYDVVMGLSGLAFRVPVDPFAATLSAEDGVAAIERLSGAIEPGLKLHDGRGMPPSAILDAVAAAVDSSLPCAVLGWGSEKGHWSVIAGYDRSRERLLGHCLLDAPREQYESWPPNPTLLVTLPAHPRPRGVRALDEAIRAAGADWTAHAASRWAKWVRAVRELTAAPPSGHIAAIEMLADARNAAARFLDALADRLEPLPAAWLRRAAERYAALAEALETGATPRNEDALTDMADRAAREQWAEALAAAARIDEAAAADLRLSQEATWLPEEADRL